jgi:hypothetical protein
MALDVRCSRLHAPLVLLVLMLSTSVATRADGADGETITPLTEASAKLAEVEGAAADAAREASFVASVRERFTTSGWVARPELEALVQRLHGAKRRLRQSARLATLPAAPRTPLERVLQADTLPRYDDRLYTALRAQRPLRAEATAVVHAARDAERIAVLALDLEQAHAAQARAALHARAARAGRARLNQLVRAATRAAAGRELEPQLQRTLAAALQAAEQARIQAAHARAELETLLRMTGTPVDSASRLIATYARDVTRVRAALQELYATWEQLEPLNHMAARYRTQEVLQALRPDASAEDVRDAVLAAEADPPMMD